MRIALLGAGHIGQTIARRLAAIGDDAATVFDRHLAPMQRLAPPKRATVLRSRTDQPSQYLAIDGLLKEAIERPDLTSGLVLCGADEDQHRCGVRPTPVADFGRQRQTIRVRHLQIDQHHIEALAGEQGSRLGRRADSKARVAEATRHVAD